MHAIVVGYHWQILFHPPLLAGMGVQRVEFLHPSTFENALCHSSRGWALMTCQLNLKHKCPVQSIAIGMTHEQHIALVESSQLMRKRAAKAWKLVTARSLRPQLQTGRP